MEKRQVLNVLRLDLVGQSIVVFALAKTTFIFRHGRSIVGQMMLVGDGRHLRGHFLDLRVGQGLNAEVVIFLKLVLHDIVAAVNLRDYVFIHNLIARQLQKVKSADGIVALAFGRFKPLLYLFSEFVVHKKSKFARITLQTYFLLGTV